MLICFVFSALHESLKDGDEMKKTLQQVTMMHGCDQHTAWLILFLVTYWVCYF